MESGAECFLVGIIYGVMTGRTEAVSAAVLDSSRDAVALCALPCLASPGCGWD